MIFIEYNKLKITLAYQYRLDQNYPNPFNSFTNIRFSLSYRSAARLAVYDILGREVVKLADTDLDAGVHTFGWNAQNYASGVYFYVLTSKDLLTGDVFEQARKMVLVK